MPPARTSIEQNDIKEYFSEERIINLDTENGEVMALFSPYMSAYKRGIVILLPEAEHTPLSPHSAGYLFESLTDDGFDTYTLQTPELNWLADEFDPLNDEKLPQENTGWSEAVLNDYKKRLIANFEALYAQLQMTSKEQLVVIAEGVSAGVFSEHLASLPNLRIDAFVSISAQLPNSERNKHLPAIISLVSPPLLDVIYSQDNDTILKSAEQRKRWVKRNSKFDYRQRELFGASTEIRQHQRLRKEVDGFLRQL